MIRSMTAFARREEQTPYGELIWEIRSVNHRYLDISLRLDESFRPLEIPIRKLFSDKLARGKIEATLRYTPPDSQQKTIHIDQQFAQSIMTQCEQLSAMTSNPAPIDLLQILQWPNVIQPASVDQTALNTAVINSLEQAITTLIAMRETEGAALKAMIEQRCQEIDAIAEDTRKQLPEILQQQRQRIQERLAEWQVSLDSERLEQEMVLLAQKTDVAEELDRLQSHIAEVNNVLQRDEPVGRRLDFLMQELNREANTLGSKSISQVTTQQAVELKVLIEQMREQIQNIE